MSVINQMLNDLDARSVDDDAPGIARMPSYIVDEQPANRFPALLRVLLFVGVGVLALWLVYVWHQSQQSTLNSVPAIATDQQPVIELPAVEVQPPTTVAAYDETSVTKAEEVVTAESIKSASSLQLQAATLSSDSRQQLGAEPESTAVVGTQADLAMAEPIKPAVFDESETMMNLVSNDKPSAEVVATESAPRSEVAAQITYRDTPDERRARNLMMDARRLALDGAEAEAITSLTQALQHDAGLMEAREHLVSLMMDQGKYQSVEVYIDEGLQLDATNELLLTAKSRLMVMRGNYQQAIALLSTAVNQGQMSMQVTSALAALYQQTGDYAASAVLYQQLLTADPYRDVWWMGLGISQDHLGQSQVALEAYRRALYSGGLKPALADYARQRIASLSGKQ